MIKWKIDLANRTPRLDFALVPTWTEDGYLIWLRSYWWILADEGGRRVFTSRMALGRAMRHESNLVAAFQKSAHRVMWSPPKPKKPPPLEKIRKDEDDKPKDED